MGTGFETRAAAQHPSFVFKASGAEQTCLRSHYSLSFGRPGASSNCCQGNQWCRRELQKRAEAPDPPLGHGVERGQGLGKVHCLGAIVPNVKCGPSAGSARQPLTQRPAVPLTGAPVSACSGARALNCKSGDPGAGGMTENSGGHSGTQTTVV